MTINLAAGTDAREHRFGNAKSGKNLAVPCQGFQVHQLGAAGVGYIGDVNSSVDPAGQVPNQERVDVAE